MFNLMTFKTQSEFDNYTGGTDVMHPYVCTVIENGKTYYEPIDGPVPPGPGPIVKAGSRFVFTGVTLYSDGDTHLYMSDDCASQWYEMSNDIINLAIELGIQDGDGTFDGYLIDSLITGYITPSTYFEGRMEQIEYEGGIEKDIPIMGFNQGRFNDVWYENVTLYFDVSRFSNTYNAIDFTTMDIPAWFWNKWGDQEDFPEYAETICFDNVRLYLDDNYVAYMTDRDIWTELYNDLHSEEFMAQGDFCDFIEAPWKSGISVTRVPITAITSTDKALSGVSFYVDAIENGALNRDSIPFEGVISNAGAFGVGDVYIPTTSLASMYGNAHLSDMKIPKWFYKKWCRRYPESQAIG